MTFAFPAAIAALHTIAEKTHPDFHALGVTEKDHEVTIANVPWLREQKSAVTATIRAVLHGTTDILGLQPITMPTEMIGAVIASFVHPVNQLIACHWMAEEGQSGRSAQALGNRFANQPEKSTAEELYSIVFLLGDESKTNSARQKFEKRLKLMKGRAEA